MDRNNKGQTELDEFLPTDGSNFKDGVLTAKYKVQVVPKDAESGLTGKDFDPFAERKNANPTTDCDTLTHLLKASLGTGILAMPAAFRFAGSVLGIFGTIFVAFVCTHCSYILVKCAHVLYRKTRKSEMSFADVAEAALANGPPCLRFLTKPSRYLIQISLFVTYFGTCSVYAIIVAEGLGEVIHFYTGGSPKLNDTSFDNGTATTTMANMVSSTISSITTTVAPAVTAALNASIAPATALAANTPIASALTSAVNATVGTSAVNATVGTSVLNATAAASTSALETALVQKIIGYLLVPLILLTWVPDLKYLAPVSMIANALMGSGLAITFYYLIVGFGTRGPMQPVGALGDFPNFFSLTVFAMEAIGVVMPLENQMKTPQNFVGIFGVLNKGMGGVTIVYILLGFLGYGAFPNSTADIITKDLDINAIPAQLVKVFVALAVFCTFGLQFYVCLDIAWTEVKGLFQKRPLLANYVLRTVLVISCVVLAILVPKINPLISLIGAFCFSILGILIPVALEIITYWDIGFGKYNWKIYKNVLIVFVGIMALIFGSKSAIESIIKELSK